MLPLVEGATEIIIKRTNRYIQFHLSYDNLYQILRCFLVCEDAIINVSDGVSAKIRNDHAGQHVQENRF